MPERIRIYYNLGLIYQYQGESQKAEQVLTTGLKIQPESFDLLYAFADYYMKSNQNEKAKPCSKIG